MGSERRSMVMSDEEKRLTAYHEGGHAIVALNVPGTDPIHKATIIPRGRALGMVMRLPERDVLSVTREKMLADISVSMGGRIAEELIFGHDKVTSGASSDIEMATRMARAMVMRWGMSDELGFITFGDNQEEVFLGHSIARTQNMSEETARKVDAEIKKIIDNCYAKTKSMLTEKVDDLHRLAKGLLEYETLSGDEIVALLRGEPPRREVGEEQKVKPGPTSAVPAAGRRLWARPRPSPSRGRNSLRHRGAARKRCIRDALWLHRTHARAALDCRAFARRPSVGRSRLSVGEGRSVGVRRRKRDGFGPRRRDEPGNDMLPLGLTAAVTYSVVMPGFMPGVQGRIQKQVSR